MFANEERIKVYKVLKALFEERNAKEKEYNSNVSLERKQELAVELAELTTKEISIIVNFYAVKEKDDHKMCDHIFTPQSENVFWCPNCRRSFIKVKDSVYDEKDYIEGKKNLTDWAGIPKLNIDADAHYKSVLYLRGYAEYKDKEAVNLRVLEDAILRLYKEDSEYYKEAVKYADTRDQVDRIDYIKEFGLY